MTQPSCLLLVLPLPIYSDGSKFYLERQACNGLRLWLDNFDRVILCNPLLRTPAPSDTRGLDDLVADGRLELCPLPAIYNPIRFAFAYPQVRRRLSRLIKRASHLQFAIGGLCDWAAVAALIAATLGRKAAIWTDRVESEVMRFQAKSCPQPRRSVRLLYAWLTKHLERYVIRRSSMGLFHGMDTFSVYSAYSPDPHLVHDIHLGPEARIPSQLFRAKQLRTQRTIKIVYAGRVHPDKGVNDWIEVLSKLAEAKTDFRAAWYGGGPALAEARQRVQQYGLGDKVAFPGPTKSHACAIDLLRAADIFLFCHRTLESPRCLIEALLSGTPIFGYESAYSSDLIRRCAGGLLVPIGDTDGLARSIQSVATNRQAISDLMQRAIGDAEPFTDERVFKHRSDLIKRLSP